uniref:Transmembrane protein 267 n=1 Tax=Glossina austeni TaxID=7395 RepID=A0A1A9UTT3_GLOAU
MQMVYMCVVLTTLVSVTCMLGDNFVDITQHPLLRALVDNATHAAIGALSGVAFAVQFYEKTTYFFGWLLMFTCFACSSLIDVDHFIAARSWNLEDAANLTCRPFLHCSTIILFLLFIYLCVSCLNYMRCSLLLGATLCAFVTHHTRDAVRRGFWFCPFGHTNRISNLTYILTTIITPYAISWLHGLCRNLIVQQFVGHFIKLNDSHLKDNHGYRYMQV